MLAEALANDDVGPGGKCPVPILLAGGIPAGSTTTTPLEAADREALAQAVAPRSPAVLARAYRHLTDAGYKVGCTALQAHRRGDCRCS